MVVLGLLLAACNSVTVENSSEPITESADSSVESSDESTKIRDEESSLTEESSESPESSGNSSDVSDTPEEPFKESVVAEKGIQNIPFTQEEIMYPNIVYHIGTYDSDLQYYSRFGDNVYVTIQINNTDDEEYLEGTQKYTNGKPTTFYPYVCKVIEYKGQAYGIYRTFGAYIDARRYYAKLNDDGSCDILFECWDVSYINGRVYYFEYNEEISEHQIISINPDTSDPIVVSEEDYTYSEAMVYNGLLIFEAYDKVYHNKYILKDGEIETLIAKDINFNFINNEYIYWTKAEEIEENGYYRYELWRQSIEDAKSEKLLTAETERWDFACTIFANKLFVFLSDNIYVYDSDFSKPKILDYGSFSMEDIEQISVTGEELTVLLYLWDGQGNVFRKTLVYNTEGELIFE